MTAVRREHPMVGVREFRDSFTNFTTTVKVIRTRKPNIEVLGTWTPNPRRSDLSSSSASPSPSASGES